MKSIDYKYEEKRTSTLYLSRVISSGFVGDEVNERKIDGWFPANLESNMEIMHQRFFSTHMIRKTLFGIPYKTVFSETCEIMGFEIDKWATCDEVPEKYEELLKEYRTTLWIMKS